MSEHETYISGIILNSAPMLDSLMKLNLIEHELLMIQKELIDIASQLCGALKREFDNRYSQLDGGV